MRLPDGLSYSVATHIFKQGMECDTASFVLAKKLGPLLREVVQEVRQIRDKEYMPEKERPYAIHMDHGTGTEEHGPDDPDCPCRGTSVQWECAHAGCGFCIAEQWKLDRSEGGN